MSTQYWSDPTLPTPIFITHPTPDITTRCEIFLSEFAKLLTAKRGHTYQPTPEDAEIYLCALLGYPDRTHFTPSESYPYNLLEAITQIRRLKPRYQQLREQFKQFYGRYPNITINVTHKYHTQQPHTS